ncbi:MAG: helix-turn-helix transcriptional regulator [Spirochaetes bacterium]|nr:helix-turn-helix transcriptional regulator [Spirochaetota bacterium]
MNLLIIAYLVTAFICFESAITIYRLNRSSRVNLLYSLFAGSFVLYSVMIIQLLFSRDENMCRFWYNACIPVYYVFFALGVHFYMELTGIKILSRSRIFPVLFYLFPVLMAFFSIIFQPFIIGFYRIQWGWGLLIKNNVWARVTFVYNIITWLICAAFAVRWRLIAVTSREKKQANVVIFSAVTGAAGIAHFFFPSMHSDPFFALAIHFYYLSCYILLVFSIGYAVKKYGLMTMTPANPVSRLFEGFKEALYLTNIHGEIVFMNETGRELTRSISKHTPERNIFDLFSAGGLLKNEVDNVIADSGSGQPLVLSSCEEDAGRILEISLLEVKNEAGSLIGLMFIVRQPGGAGELKDVYGLSPREIEVLLLLCSGLSAGQIANECGITLQTAKTHIHNIYKKCGLSNRVELSNLVNKFL